MKKFTSKDFRTMPWKNGGGSTTELAIFPQGASLDNFMWRLSTATVASDGPFSFFPEIDRSLAILSGDSLTLTTQHPKEADAVLTQMRLTSESEPYRFAGEDVVMGKLSQGLIVDLNCMTRRTTCQHHMQKLTQGEHHIAAADAQQILLYCAQGNVNIGDEQIGQEELLVFDEAHKGNDTELHIKANQDAVLYLIKIRFTAP
jgi:environmental stress-induced protein Ves